MVSDCELTSVDICGQRIRKPALGKKTSDQLEPVLLIFLELIAWS